MTIEAPGNEAVTSAFLKLIAGMLEFTVSTEAGSLPVTLRGSSTDVEALIWLVWSETQPQKVVVRFGNFSDEDERPELPHNSVKGTELVDQATLESLKGPSFWFFLEPNDDYDQERCPVLCHFGYLPNCEQLPTVTAEGIVFEASESTRRQAVQTTLDKLFRLTGNVKFQAMNNDIQAGIGDAYDGIIPVVDYSNYFFVLGLNPYAPHSMPEQLFQAVVRGAQTQMLAILDQLPEDSYTFILKAYVNQAAHELDTPAKVKAYMTW